jgi:signal transduction histidine kinase
MGKAKVDSLEDLRRDLAESERRYNELLADVEHRAHEIAVSKFQTEMTRVSSELAHDLRGPLQTITNSLFLMERKPGDTTYFPKISEALKQATSLLDAFREYYRGHEITPMQGDINKLLEKALEDSEIPSTIKVSTDLGQGLPPAMLDLIKVKRVFSTIIKNAVEAMPDGGSLSISTRLVGDKILSSFSDTGVGIPEAAREKIFVAFGQKKKGGFGLGLAAAKRIIEAHGGSIAFESETGRGTTFTVAMPVGKHELSRNI